MDQEVPHHLDRGPFDQDDWEAWSYFTANSGVTVIGDDLTVTNPCAAQLSQSDTGRHVLAPQGETEDVTIADLTVGLATGIIKTGASLPQRACCQVQRPAPHRVAREGLQVRWHCWFREYLKPSCEFQGPICLVSSADTSIFLLFQTQGDKAPEVSRGASNVNEVTFGEAIDATPSACQK
ncbi:hypothetical protein L7F22_023159 [Adiantum nelumboides]|nr:hypothetical protein [Adiantum nelumboides]